MAAHTSGSSSHPSEFKASIPELDSSGSNFNIWKSCFLDTIYVNDIDYLFEPDYTPPEAGSPQYKKYRKDCANIRMAILSSLPTTFETWLEFSADDTPMELYNKLKAHFTASSATDHAILRQEAESAVFTKEMSVDEFVLKHRQIRAKMRLANYPQIENDESVSVGFMIKGLEANRFYKHLLDAWIENGTTPATIKEVEARLKAISARQKTKPPSLAPSPAQGLETPKYSSRGRGRFRGRRGFNPYIPQIHPGLRTNNSLQYFPPPTIMQHPAQPILNYQGPAIFSPHLGYAGPKGHTDTYKQPHYQGRGGRAQRKGYKTEANFTGTQYQQGHKEHDMDDFSTEDYYDNTLHALEAQIDEAGTYALDSGAHPTHLMSPTQQMEKLRTPLCTNTATNSSSRATHRGFLNLQTTKNASLKLPAVANPSLRHNLISVHDAAKQWGKVTFYPNQAYVINSKTACAPPIIATANFRNGLYRLCLPKDSRESKHNSTCLASRTFQRRATKGTGRPTSQCKTKAPCTAHVLPKPTTSPTSTPTPPTKPKKYVLPPQKPSSPELRSNYNPGPDPTKKSPHDKDFHHYHLLFNHVRPDTIQQMARLNLIPGMPRSLLHNPPKLTCSSCAEAKQNPRPHLETSHHYGVAVSVSSDICGPITPISRQQNKYIMTFIDTRSKYLIVDFLQSRKQAPERIKLILQHINKIHLKHPEYFRTDNAKEYTSKDAQQVYAEHNLTHSVTVPYRPQENSIAERINGTILAAARCSLHHSGLPLHHWEDAVRDAVYKYNRIMHTRTKQLPYTAWFGTKPPNVPKFVFGQLGTIPHLADRDKLQKLSPRAHPARYLYSTDDSHITVLNIRRNREERVRTVDFKTYHRDSDPTASTTAAFKTVTFHPTPTVISTTTPAPSSLSQAQKYPDAASWHTAHDAELDSIDNNGVIKWIPDKQLPRNEKLVPLTMGYRYKRNSEGDVAKHKARCAVRGDKMIAKVHYDPDNTTTYTADKTTVRLLFAISAAYNLFTDHLDIEAAFLHEKFPHDGQSPVYVKQLPRFDGTYKHPCKGGLLVGNLYGGPGAGYTYLQAAFQHLRSFGFKQSHADPCLFSKTTSEGVTFIAVTIDDFQVAATTERLLDKFFEQLSSKYKVKRLGPTSNYLGWTVRRFSDGSIHISQPAAIKAVLAKTRMNTANGKDTPYLDGCKLSSATAGDAKKQNRAQEFQTILGDIRYIADSTRPDIYFITNRLAAASKNPSDLHWTALKRLLRYLKATESHGLYYRKLQNRNALTSFAISDKGDYEKSTSHPRLESYSDADHAADQNDRKSISGIVHLYNQTPVSWSSSKQKITALSTCEAEYVAATTAVQQTSYIRRILRDIRMLSKEPTPFYIDNQAAIQIAKNKGPTKRRKFIDLRHHYLSAHIARGTISIKHVPSDKMLADAFTKPLRAKQFTQIVRNLNIISLHHAKKPNSCNMPCSRPGECRETN